MTETVEETGIVAATICVKLQAGVRIFDGGGVSSDPQKSRDLGRRLLSASSFKVRARLYFVVVGEQEWQ